MMLYYNRSNCHANVRCNYQTLKHNLLNELSSLSRLVYKCMNTKDEIRCIVNTIESRYVQYVRILCKHEKDERTEWMETIKYFDKYELFFRHKNRCR